MLFITFRIYFLKGRRVDCLLGNQHMKKKFYKNNVGYIIFMKYIISAKYDVIMCNL